MIEASLIQKESTRKIIGALESLHILELISFKELNSYCEVLFRIEKEDQPAWIGVINRLVGINDALILSKKFVTKEGELAVIWCLAVASHNLDEDINTIVSHFNTNITKTSGEVAKQSKQGSRLPTKKLFNKTIIKPVHQDPENNITVWEIPIHADENRNRPKELPDGSMSTKGAFEHSKKGLREWSKAVSYQRKRGV
jgi:hypothetical protein